MAISKILEKILTWEKGVVIPGKDQAIWRMDAFSKLIKFADYGRTDSEFGWQIDHVIPISRGGTNCLSNLQPLQWRTNLEKSDKLPLERELSPNLLGALKNMGAIN